MIPGRSLCNFPIKVSGRAAVALLLFCLSLPSCSGGGNNNSTPTAQNVPNSTDGTNPSGKGTPPGDTGADSKLEDDEEMILAF